MQPQPYIVSFQGSKFHSSDRLRWVKMTVGQVEYLQDLSDGRLRISDFHISFIGFVYFKQVNGTFGQVIFTIHLPDGQVHSIRNFEACIQHFPFFFQLTCIVQSCFTDENGGCTVPSCPVYTTIENTPSIEVCKIYVPWCPMKYKLGVVVVCFVLVVSSLNTLRLRQNSCHFADDIFKRIFVNEKVWISIKISLKFVSKCPVSNMSALVQIMAGHWPGCKPLSEPIMVRLYQRIYAPSAAIIFMMTSSNGIIFRVTGHLCREFTGPCTKASDTELWCFLWFASE